MNELINKYTFLIGANNKTKRRELKKAEEILNNNEIKGFNISLNNGFWNKEKENSFKVEILNTKEINVNDKKMLSLKEEFTKGLNQFVVLLEKTEVSLLGGF